MTLGLGTKSYINTQACSNASLTRAFTARTGGRAVVS